MGSIKHIDFMNRSIIFLDLEGSASDFEIIDVGEKAKKLVKLSSRNELLVLYNLGGIPITRNLLQHMRSLMVNSGLVSRRVMYGIDAKYSELIRQVMQSLGLGETTRFADNYPQALNIITDDSQWVERRQKNPSTPVVPDRRQNSRTPPSAEELQERLNKLP